MIYFDLTVRRFSIYLLHLLTVCLFLLMAYVDVDVLSECKGIVSLPTFGNKNSLNIATCVGIVAWEYLRQVDAQCTTLK